MDACLGDNAHGGPSTTAYDRLGVDDMRPVWSTRICAGEGDRRLIAGDKHVGRFE